MTESEDPSGSRFRVLRDWQTLTAEDAEAIQAFWRREGAIVDEKSAQARLREVVMHACDETGQIVAVCTAYAATWPQFGQPMYVFRCFVGRAWRTTRLVFILLLAARNCLEEHARANAFPCIGILLELENPRFHDVHDDEISKLRKPVWSRSGFTYVGRSQRGLDLRAYYFKGAQLKRSAARTSSG